MADDDRRLTREEGTVRPARRSGRVVRGRGDDGLRREESGRDARRRRRRDDDEDEGDRPRRRARRGRRGRPPLRDEFTDLGRGTGYVGTESLAVAMDIVSRVLRGAVDNLLDEDYSEPGDVVRGITNEADLAAYDLVDELRKAPRRLDRRFDEGIRSPRADRGERARRSDD